MMRARGFTLIELMVALAVLAIVVGIGVPSYQDYVANQRVKTASQSLFMSLLLARSEAIKRNQTVTVSASDGDWEKGWVVSASGQDIRVEQSLQAVGMANSPVSSLSFSRNGRLQGGGSATLEFCDSAGRAIKRVVALSLAGQPYISREGSCS